MIDQVECLWYLISLLLHLFHVLRKAISMALCSNPSTHGPSPSPLSWKRTAEPPISARKRSKEASDRTVRLLEDASLNSSVIVSERSPRDNFASERKELVPKTIEMDEYPQHVSVSRPRDVGSKFELIGSDSVTTGEVGGGKASHKPRKRPSRIVIPESCVGFGDAGKGKESVEKELEVEGSGYCLASKKGGRHVMEDGYGVITNIHGDSKQAFFGVFDGHGGRAAVDFVSEKLGRNIITAISEIEEEDQLELAIKAGYLTTDREFLNQNVSSGACAATVLLKNGELHVSNVGDCRVVMSRRGVATALTRDHSAGREDERIRIESSGGYMTCRNGIWRVQDSLAVSRAIGDTNMKEWVISEPETTKIGLTPACEFLILASDGLWDKVSNQEAVDVVSRNKNSMKSCKELVGMSSKRGSRDDITVMVVDLQRFVQLGG